MTEKPNAQVLLLWISLIMAVAMTLAACQNRASEGAARDGAPTQLRPALSITPPPALAPVTGIATPDGWLTAAPTRTPAPETGPTQAPDGTQVAFLPQVGAGEPAPPTATPVRLEPPSATPTLDFAAVRASLRAQGQDLAYVKVGVHVTLPNEAEQEALKDWMQRLDAAGVPFFLKSVANAEPLFLAQQMMARTGVPHTLVFRSIAGDVPDYDRPPAEAARLHWEQHKAQFPPELDPALVWVETINEVDRNRAEWLGQFALATADLMLADGFRWAAFSWSAGVPERENWETPSMLRFLRLAAANPDRLAIALHEGSGTVEDVTFEYPFRTGRFLQLFDVADRHGFARPTVLITEWGWSYDNVPAPDKAMADIAWAARLYGPFPEVKGAAIWNLGAGCCFAEVSEGVSALLPHLANFSLNHYVTAPLPPARATTNPALYAP